MSGMIAREGRIAVVGLGVTGLAAVEFLQQLGYGVIGFESSEDAAGLVKLRERCPTVPAVVGPLTAASSALKADRLPVGQALPEKAVLAHLLGCTQILLSPGVPRSLPAIQAALAAGIPVRGDVDWFAQYALRPILAVTGSNGKSTVVTWLAHVLSGADLPVALGGNIGVPVLALLRQPEPAAYVLELSSFQLESTEQLACEVACILNVSQDHLDRYESFEAYAMAKQRIYRGTKHAVVNRADPLTYGLFSQSVTVHSFGLDHPEPEQFGVIHRDGEAYLAHGNTCLMPVKSLRLKGDHQVSNALAVLAMAHAFGMPLEILLEPLQTFSGLPHRCQVVGEYDGVTYYNDSKATNVGAAESAIQGLGPLHRVDDKPGIVLLLGGQGKGADFTPLRAAVQAYACRVFVFGESANELYQVLSDVAPTVITENMIQALAQARACVQVGGAVLLSPACASLDQFSNFEARGHRFAEWVQSHL